MARDLYLGGIVALVFGVVLVAYALVLGRPAWLHDRLQRLAPHARPETRKPLAAPDDDASAGDTGDEIYVPAQPSGRRPGPKTGAPAAPVTANEPYLYRDAGARTAVQAPPLPTAPMVKPFVIDGTHGGREHEPRLPARVVAGGGWHDSFFRGWCGAGDGPRPVPRLVVRAAALRGASHANLGTEGQDAIGAAWDERHRALYVAVADGLGSLPQSGRVATEAISAALHLCASRPDTITFADNGRRLFEAIAAGLRRTFNPAGAALDGACTLVVAEVVPRPDGASVTVHGVGDSEAWLLHESDWRPLHHERREHDNATRELPTHARPDTKVFHVPPGSVLLLGSDGFAGAFDTSVSPLARGLAEHWRRPPTWVEFVNHVNFIDDYWSDDRAALAVWIGEGPGHG